MHYRECFRHLGGIERRRIVTADNVMLRLNRGERPHPHHPLVQAEVADALLAAYVPKLQQYPSYQKFYQQLADMLQVAPQNIVVGAGIEEFIRTLTFLCCNPREKMAVLWPTCAMYDIYANAFDVDLVRIKPMPGHPLTIAPLIAELAAHEQTLKLVFIPNPGQPVETHYAEADLRLLARWCRARRIILAVDEAHYGFGAATALPLIYEFDNVLVLRTFSKFFGAASIRVGCVIGTTSIIKPLDAVRPSGEVSGPSMAVASVLMENLATLTSQADRVVEGRNWLRERVTRELGLRAWGQFGFSVLIEFPTHTVACAVGMQLASQGVYVKVDFPPPVERCMLLACGPIPLMEAFFSELRVAYNFVREPA